MSKSGVAKLFQILSLEQLYKTIFLITSCYENLSKIINKMFVVRGRTISSEWNGRLGRSIRRRKEIIVTYIWFDFGVLIA